MSMMGIGLTGLIAAQKGLEATSNNVANAGTDGYVRRRVNQATVITSGSGVTAGVGAGVRVIGIERLYDSFLADSLRAATSTEQRARIRAELSTRLDGLLGNPESGIGTSVQAFFDRVEALSRNPTSDTAREQVLMQGESLAERFQQLGRQLDTLGNEVNRRIEDSVSRINALAVSLARINESLGRGASGVNDLIDQRDQLLQELSTQIDASVVMQDDGTVTVSIANGQPLVLGIHHGTLALTADDFDPTRPALTIGFGTQSIPVSRQIGSGTLGGLLSFKTEALDGASRDLDLLAASLANAFNAQHTQGVDAEGNLGGQFFTPATPQVAASSSNGGSAVVSATVDDPAALTARNYELRFNGGSWQLSDASTGEVLNMTGSGTTASPFRFDGLAVSVAGSAAAGDRYLLRPVGDAAGNFTLAIGDGRAIAAALPVGTSRVLANGSDAGIALTGISDAAAAATQPLQIRFTGSNQFHVYDAGNNDLSGALAFTSGADISFSGWTVRITGSPVTGDRFDIVPTPAGSGDNGNALALSQLGARGYLGNGQVSTDDLSARLVARVGSMALHGNQDLAVQSALREQAELDLDAVAGVNLDEEAANLLRYQQAYQAASKVIAVADDLFQTLLGAIR